MRSPTHFKQSIIAKSIGLMLGTVIMAPALAQQASDDTEVIQVKGIRGSLQESMSIKRESIGVVDAISAEDIGKFPDSNLAESLQRISGVSISRQDGEGKEVTVRGFGGDKNMVTLNGRMMPVASAFGGGGGSTRAFDFGNLASESVRAVEVYKTGKASLTTGGIGATINIITAKPLDSEGLNVSVGAKAMHDTTNRTGSDITPELSGIISYANDDSTWGVGLTVSHQQRDSGSSSANVNGWSINEWSADDATNFKNIPIQNGPNGESDLAYKNSRVTNAPAVGQLYGQPLDMRYYFVDTQRDRTNAQLTVQFAPTDKLTGTVDYSFAENDIMENSGDAVYWLNRTWDDVTFDTSEAVATTAIINESLPGTKDNGNAQQSQHQVNTLNSLGVNLEYLFNDDLAVTLDVHSSEMESAPGNLGGIGAGMINSNMAAPIGLHQTHDYRGALPKVTMTIDDCVAANCNGIWDAGDFGTNYLRIGTARQTTNIDQIKLDATYELDEGSFDMGIETRAIEMQQQVATSWNKQGDWGVNNPGEIPAGMINEFDMLAEFSDFDTTGINVKTFIGDATELAKWSAPVYDIDFAKKADQDDNHMVTEDTLAVYLQYSLQSEIGGMPTNVLAGVRYESTDVESISEQTVPIAILWTDNNDSKRIYGDGASMVQENHSYNHVLPSLDIDLAVTDDIKARMSFGQTIARAGYNQLRASIGSPGTNGPALLNSKPTASSSNPGLVPLLSTNFDVSVEYYFDDTSYVSVGFFDKRVSNFIGNAEEKLNHFGLRDSSAGPRAIAALAALQAEGLETDETSLFVMTAILDNPADFPLGAAEYKIGLDTNPSFVNDVAFDYDITPNGDDPLFQFLTSRPTNNKDANLYGLELAAQHFFGDTGFGLSANFTMVRGDVKYDNTAPASVSQFALTGLSDSANLVAMYENHGIQARIAYNWRDEFLSGAGTNPTYVEEYGQIDFSVSYDISEELSVSVQGLNITEEDSRTHGRAYMQLGRLYDLGARYQVGARYNF